MQPTFRWRIVPFAFTSFSSFIVLIVAILYSWQIGIPEVLRLYKTGFPQSAFKFAVIPLSFFVVSGLLCLVSWLTFKAKYELAIYCFMGIPMYLFFAYFFVYSV